MSESRQQLTRAFLLVLTVAAVVAAVFNFRQQAHVRLPEDGVFWSERDGKVIALMVQPGSPAERAGVHEGDFLLRINRQPVNLAQDVAQIFVGLPSWEKVDYSLLQNGVEFEAHVILGERALSSLVYYQYFVGGVYLLIGLFIFFRRGVAAQATHVYVLCLASFVLSTFHFTGRLDDFDKVMYWGNVFAGLIAPTIFLHFCLSFPESGRWTRGFWRSSLLYIPATLAAFVFMGFASGIIRTASPMVEVNWMLDRLWLAFLTGGYLLGGLVLAAKSRTAKDPVVRMQLKWLRNGAIFAILPFAIFYAIPYVMGGFPGESAKLAVLALLLMPLTWAYAIVRYRLMDVDVIFQQGYVYTLATIAVLGVFYIFIFSIGSFDSLSPTAVAILILIAAFAFQPIRNWLQEQLDKHVFYKDQYNYRRTLIEFARELGAETDLDRMLSSVADRLIRTVGISHIAFFLSEEGGAGMKLRLADNVRDRKGRPVEPGYPLDLSYLANRPEKGHLFFERTRHLPDPRVLEYPPAARETIADLDLTYYFPCDARGRTIAWFGVSRLDRGDFLTSDDLELLVTLSGYVGIAIENALLYQSLRHKAAEYERLKEYNENIVESINVGILAADLEGRVESWNSTMETLTGVPRNIAVGRRMEELLPADLCREIASVGAAESVHNIYQYEFRSSMLPSRTPETAPVARTFQAEAPSYSPAMGFATGGEKSDAFALQPAAAHAGSTGHAGTRMTAPAGYGGPGIAPAVASAPEVFKGAGGTNGSNGVPDGNGSIPSSETEENRLPEELTLNIAVTPLVSRDFEHIGRLVLFQDVTERTELERRLVQSDKLTSIGVLAAGVAHEVNTPLAVISSYSQMLAKQLADDERKSGLLDKIAKQTFRASEIVNSLLNFSRTSNTTYGSTDLNSVVEETLLLIAPQLEKARIRVERDMQAPLPSIRGNGSKLQQVFLNIILNARDSMSDGGILRISTSADATSVRVRVSDTGHGIPTDKLARIFDPFYTTKMAGKGTGLGLSISYGIVREHGGIIEVSSRSGEGATFVMEFPREQRALTA
ncbi:MAG: GAF domain-containing protein [Bryobacterales bacterium]|nr:GAF domain-containing protein [Bryobacterales bacterium]